MHGRQKNPEIPHEIMVKPSQYIHMDVFLLMLLSILRCRQLKSETNLLMSGLIVAIPESKDSSVMAKKNMRYSLLVFLAIAVTNSDIVFKYVLHYFTTPFTRKLTEADSRIACLFTVDDQSPRTVHSKQLHSHVGFTVRLEFAPNSTHDKVLSNTMTQLAIYERIIADEIRPWGYIFEDDIVLVGKSPDKFDDKIDFSVEHDLISDQGMESFHPFFFYLGICVPQEEDQNDRYCDLVHTHMVSQEREPSCYRDLTSHFLPTVLQRGCAGTWIL